MRDISKMPFGTIYPLYVQKVERKGRTNDELDAAIEWLTGFDRAEVDRRIAEGTTLERFFADATLNPGASSITGVICGVRVEDIEDPFMKKVRYLDKLVDEIAKGRPMQKVLRQV